MNPTFTSPDAGNTTDPSTPDYRRPESAAILPELDMMQDLLGGTRRMHEQAARYIRQWSAELPEVYRIRSRCETLYGGFARVLDASVGMMFAKPPVLSFSSDDVQAAVTPHWYNIDAAGTAGEVFAKRFAQWALRDGLALLLVDHPQADGAATLADEARLNLRPTWAMYERRHILSWQTETLDNADTLTLVTLSEPTTVANGYGISVRHRVRVLRLVDGLATWQLIDMTDDDPALISEGVFRDRRGVPFSRLPVAVAYTGDVLAPLVTRPPLLPVAYANVAHYQISTDLRFYRSLAAYPQPVVEGNLAPDPTTGLPQTLNLGPMVAIRTAEGGRFSWAEITGSSLQTLVSGVDEKLDAMAQLGLAFLVGDKKGQQTAEARRLDASAENSTLATAAQGITDALNVALELHAQYLGVPAENAPTVAIALEYDSTALDAQTMGAIAALVREGLPKIDAVRLLQAGGRLPADRDPLEVAMEWEAGASAMSDLAGSAGALA
jgi:hypothetical protein